MHRIKMETILIRRFFLLIASIAILMEGITAMASKTTSTEPEIQILASTGASEIRIRNGNLTDTEKQDLVVFSAVEEQMRKRYPTENILFVEMEVRAGGAEYIFRGFTEDEGPEEQFDVLVQIEKEGVQTEYKIKDNLIGQKMRADLTERIIQMLKTLDITSVEGVLVTVPYLADAEFDRSLSIDEHITIGDMPACSIRIELNAIEMTEEEFQAIGDKINKAMRESGLTGSIYIIGSVIGRTGQPWDRILYRYQILI